MSAKSESLLSYGNRIPSLTYWCKRCNVPLIQEKCERCGNQGIIISKSSLRPVYEEELDIIKKESKARSKWLSLPDLLFWAAKRNYFYNGEKVFTSIGLADGKPLDVKLYKGND